MSHWDKQAIHWDQITEPLRPSTMDIQVLTQWIYRYYQTNYRPLTVLLLGVTPEIVNISWPEKTKLLTVDQNMDMIKLIFRKQSRHVKSIAIAAHWLHLPFQPSSFDLIVGDGCYNLLAFSEYKMLTHSIQSLLRQNGLFIFRFFLRPDLNASLEKLKNDVTQLQIKNFSTFKLRLLIALHDDIQQGVSLKNTWNCWNLQFKTIIHHLKDKLQWTEESINVINHYKNQNAFYTFPSLHEVKQHLNQYLNEQEIFTPPDQLSVCCPTFVFSKQK